jgi:uncharacterized OB-fold protein
MSATIVDAATPRMLPKLTDTNRAFLTGGAEGQLLIQRCGSCDRWVHPPTDSCPTCAGPLVAEPVSGRGTVFTYTLNFQKFHPDQEPPDLIAIVVLDEQDDLRLVTDLVETTIEDVSIGMPVEVLFERHGEIYYPIFRPVGSGS